MKTTQCCICGTEYDTTAGKDKVIYGCRKCHKGNWTFNNRQLIKVEKKKKIIKLEESK